MKTSVFKEHENCIRKLIITIDLTKRTLSFILRHISKDDQSIYHDVDEFSEDPASVTITPAWLAMEAVLIGNQATRSKKKPYSNVEIHIEKGYASNQDVIYARDRLYKNGWHSIDEDGLCFINYCESKEENEDGNKTL